MARNTVHGIFGAFSEIQVQSGTTWLPLDNAQSFTFSSNAGTEYTTVNLKGSYARPAEELPESASIVVSPFMPHLPVYADVLAASGPKLFRAYYGVPEDVVSVKASSVLGISTTGVVTITGSGADTVGELFGPEGPVGTTAVLMTGSGSYVVTKIGGGATPEVIAYDLSTGAFPSSAVTGAAGSWKIINPGYRRQFRATVVTKSNESLTAEAVVENTIDLRLTSPLVKGTLVTALAEYFFSGT